MILIKAIGKLNSQLFVLNIKINEDGSFLTIPTIDAALRKNLNRGFSEVQIAAQKVGKFNAQLEDIFLKTFSANIKKFIDINIQQEMLGSMPVLLLTLAKNLYECIEPKITNKAKILYVQMLVERYLKMNFWSLAKHEKNRSAVEMKNLLLKAKQHDKLDD